MPYPIRNGVDVQLIDHTQEWRVLCDFCPETAARRNDATHRVRYGTPMDIEVVECCGACLEAHFGTERLD